MDAVRPLNYAPKPSIRQRFSLRVYRLIIIAAVIVAAFAWGSGMWRHSQLAYWQYQCLNFQQPPDHVVSVIKQGNIVHQEFCQPLNRFLGLNKHPISNGTIFLHEMRRPDQTSCLVSLVISPMYPGQGEVGRLHFEYMQWNISLWPRLLSWTYIPLMTNGVALSQYKFFAGQPDPNNASHLTLDYDIDGQRHTADGWLNNDNQLIMSQRP